MSDSQLAELNDLLETLGQVPIDGKKQKAAVA
jgi:hypothetical protein